MVMAMALIIHVLVVGLQDQEQQQHMVMVVIVSALIVPHGKVVVKMSNKFKAGDKVRCIRRRSQIYKGQHFIVDEAFTVNSKGYIMVTSTKGVKSNIGWMEDDFELMEN